MSDSGTQSAATATAFGPRIRTVAESARDYLRIYAKHPECDPEYYWISAADGKFVGVTEHAGVLYVDFRGTATLNDLVMDFKALPVMDSALGMLHAGFAHEVWNVQDELDEVVKGWPVVVQGHSLGAARAAIYAGHLTAKGVPPLAVRLWGCPRPGYARLRSILAPIPIDSYRNCNDPVTDVPLDVDLPGEALDFPYEHVREFIQLQQPAGWFDLWGPVKAHHMQLYVKALEKLALKGN